MPKLLGQIVARQLNEYLQLSELLPSLQSGFRPNNWSKTAVLRVLSDLLEAVDSAEVAALVLLDVFAAFDAFNHQYFVSTSGTHLDYMDQF